MHEQQRCHMLGSWPCMHGQPGLSPAAPTEAGRIRRFRANMHYSIAGLLHTQLRASQVSRRPGDLPLHGMASCPACGKAAAHAYICFREIPLGGIPSCKPAI